MASPVDAAKGPQLEELPTTEPDKIQVLPVVNFTVLDVLDVEIREIMFTLTESMKSCLL